MADAFTTRVRAEKPEVNANEDTWGDELNANTIDMFDEAIAGIVSVAVSGSNITLSANNGTADESRNPILILTGTPGTTRQISYPDVEGHHWVINNTDAAQTIKAGAGTSVSVANGCTALIYTDGATNAVMAFQTATGLTIATLTGTQTLTNKLIEFPASQNASSNANTLDDYEEGTWTPTLGDGTNNYTLTTAVGYYVKKGKEVSAHFYCVWTSIGSAGASQLRVSQLPFTSQNTGNERFGTAFAAMGGIDLTATLNPIVGLTAGNQTIISLSRVNDNASQTASPANGSSASGELGGSVVYIASA